MYKFTQDIYILIEMPLKMEGFFHPIKFTYLIKYFFFFHVSKFNLIQKAKKKIDLKFVPICIVLFDPMMMM